MLSIYFLVDFGTHKGLGIDLWTEVKYQSQQEKKMRNLVYILIGSDSWNNLGKLSWPNENIRIVAYHSK